jgi:hypothetical protein
MADDAFTGHLRRVLERDAVVHRVTTAWLPAQLSVSAGLRGDAEPVRSGRQHG